MLGRSQQGAEPSLPLLDVEVVFVLQRAPQDRREFVERLEQLAGGLAQRLLLEAVIARAHVLEDRLLGARGDNRLRLALDEYVGALPRAASLLDRRQADNAIRAPVLSVAEEDHPASLYIHGLFLSHFPLELLELARRGGFARRAVHVGLEQLVLQIHARVGIA